MFCNPDLIWKSEFDRPRLGQGAFKESFLAVYQVFILSHSIYALGLLSWIGVELDRQTIPVYAVWETYNRNIQIC